MITIQNQNFGVEIELTGITRQAAAQVIADYYGTIGTRFMGTVYKTYIQFCLAMSAWSINCDHDNLHFKSIAGYTQQQKHDLMMRVLTKRLGMRGPEFKTARLHLTAAFETAPAVTAA